MSDTVELSDETIARLADAIVDEQERRFEVRMAELEDLDKD